MDIVELHTKHASQYSTELAEVAKQLLTAEAFSLQIPVALDRGQGWSRLRLGRFAVT